MKVNIGPYRSWFGPYQLAELLCFWVPTKINEYGNEEHPEWVHLFGEWLAHGSIEQPDNLRTTNDDETLTLLYKFLLWIDSKRKRKIKVKLDRWDTWNANETIAYIVHPLLVQLRDQKQGSPHVHNEDVPEELWMTEENKSDYSLNGTIDKNWHDRWDWVLDEIIWAFGEQLRDWESDFYSGEHDVYFEKLEDGSGHSVMKHGPWDTFKIDQTGMKLHKDRIDNGMRLFGKYYSNLWT